jgi:carboxyl-terminal processing protease
MRAKTNTSIPDGIETERLPLTAGAARPAALRHRPGIFRRHTWPGRALWVLTCAAVLQAGQASAAEPDSAQPQSPAVRKFVQVLERIKVRYADRVDEDKLVDDAIEGMLKGLDRHSTFLDADTFREVRRENRGKVAGLGLEVALDNGVLRLSAIAEDAPAARAGLKPGDVVTRVDDASVAGQTAEQFLQRTRGDAGTDVALTVIPKGATEPRVVRLTRALVRTRTVRAVALESGVIHVQITQFSERTPEELVGALRRLYSQSATRGIVLDLRDNPGGLLRSAIAVSAAFLPYDALVVNTDGASTDARAQLHARSEHYLRDNVDDPLKALPAGVKTVPLTVLVNGGSASASEIVAGALQDHRRALIMGTRSYGKGSVQSIIPLGDDTAVKLTTSYYRTPAGRVIQGQGITPDVIVEQADGSRAGAAASVRTVALEQQVQDRTACLSSLDMTACQARAVQAPEPGKDAARAADPLLEQAVDLLTQPMVLSMR